uniref:Uncharacterized protein n=1 Tax=Chrysotila carterae TaxID=13221 RepID=A0A7S4F118_CHRCT
MVWSVCSSGLHYRPCIRPIDGAAQAAMSDAAPPEQRRTEDGSLHQLLWMRTCSGVEVVADFTGPQYGIDERLHATDTPFWRCEVGPRLLSVYGFQLLGEPCRFSSFGGLPALPIENKVHLHVALLIRDSLSLRLLFEHQISRDFERSLFPK